MSETPQGFAEACEWIDDLRARLADAERRIAAAKAELEKWITGELIAKAEGRCYSCGRMPAACDGAYRLQCILTALDGAGEVGDE